MIHHLAAVGPDVLNSWKIEVLSELYFRAAEKFTAEGALEPAERDKRRQAVRDEFRACNAQALKTYSGERAAPKPEGV